jgi:hypothetical protein
METTTRPLPTADAPGRLTAHDRCDSCGAQAYVRATLLSGAALLFCGHHGNAHRPALLVAGADLHDETDRLTARGESGIDG